MKKIQIMILMFSIIATVAIGCREKKSTGDKIEDAVEETGDKIEEGAEEVGDAVEDATDGN